MREGGLPRGHQRPGQAPQGGRPERCEGAGRGRGRRQAPEKQFEVATLQRPEQFHFPGHAG
eukprot:13554201-Alexandrium_andersonii.AAC.1